MSLSFVRVGDLSEQVRGVTYGKEDASKTPADGYLPVLRAGNITDFGLVYSDLVYVPAGKVSAKQKLRTGDIVVAASSGSLDVVGKTAPVLCDFEGGFGAFCKVLRPNARVEANYFSQFFKTPRYRKIISALAAGANINNLRNEHLDELLVPLPPLPEQRRIAAILDQADALRAKRRAALAQLDSLTQSIFIEMFGDPVTNSKRLPTKRLGEITTFQNGDRSGNYPSGDDIKEEGILFLSTKNITDGQLDLSKSVYITKEKFDSFSRGKTKRGDLIITLRGTLGSCCIFDSKHETAFINAQMMIIRPSTECLSAYLHALLTSQQAQERFDHIGRGAAVPQLTSAQMAGLEIPVPPLADQQVFSLRKRTLDGLKAKQEEAIVELDALFASLQHRAFRGEL